MAKKIVSIVHPFMLKQQVYVYEDGNKIDVVEAQTSELPNIIAETANKYEIIDINLGGSKRYNKALGTKISESYLSKYSTKGKQIEIKMI